MRPILLQNHIIQIGFMLMKLSGEGGKPWRYRRTEGLGYEENSADVDRGGGTCWAGGCSRPARPSLHQSSRGRASRELDRFLPVRWWRRRALGCQFEHHRSSYR